MRKFKVGDRVCRVESRTDFARMPVGATDTVEMVDQGGLTLKKYGYGHDPNMFELVKEEENRHIHHDLIIAWAKGAKIEIYNESAKVWVPSKCPAWSTICKYRIKPEPKPDVTLYARACKTAPKSGCLAGAMMVEYPDMDHNVKFTFDGETNVLKSVELINQLNKEQV